MPRGRCGIWRSTWAWDAAAGPPPSPQGLPTLPRPRPRRTATRPRPERDALLAWSTESAEQLLSALRAAGPDRGCWTWWDRSESRQTSRAVARHQLQEVATPLAG
ncbi:maleylpyruvate isomerase N-terminal domain-containing protein [Micromonospora rubida]|uniref:maleylpyruvate isomerase N-terminal domain-containing protein n=1 Tax=Micromonospora rubida TaxID=2697657 RepID=UPI00137726F8|nr:hypothetical protein [Micromonospora rubida]